MSVFYPLVNTYFSFIIKMISIFLTDNHTGTHIYTLTSFNNSLQISLTAVISLQTTNRPHPLDFELTQHLSLSAPQDLSAPLHLFTSHVSFHLGTHHSSSYLWPNSRFHQLPAALTASHPPFQRHYMVFFSDPLAPLIPSLPPSVSTSHLNQSTFA